MKIKIDKRYPEMLTIDDVDKIFSFKGFDEEVKAANYAKKVGGQFYTQVDSYGSDDVIYLRGHHVVNRTGYWIVIRANPSEFKLLKKIMQRGKK